MGGIGDTASCWAYVNNGLSLSAALKRTALHSKYQSHMAVLRSASDETGSGRILAQLHPLLLQLSCQNSSVPDWTEHT